ncbi:MAG: FAD-binding oxidoreductase [Amylibacter sp.]|nr:FAD-binding oxidoreductase [Amylibacter sp.]
MKTADFIIIGGGIAGISAAAMLSKQASVIVLESEKQLGYHSTSRSAAMFIRNYGNATLRALNASAEPFFLNPEGVSDLSLLSPRGELLVADEDELAAFSEYAKGSQGLETLTADEAVEMVPILRKDRIAAALYEQNALDIDVDRLFQGYIRLARRQGSKIEVKQQVLTIERRGSSWHITTADQEYLAPVVINAAGAWADEVARISGVTPIGITPMRRSAALIPAPSGHDITSWPLFGSASEKWYAKPDAGALLVSPADETPVDPHDAWVDDMVLAEGIDRFEQAVTISVTKLNHSWAGLRSFAPDRTPVVGFDPQADSFFWLAGQGGYGVQTAPALSCLTAALCLGQKPALGDDIIAALSPIRFR